MNGTQDLLLLGVLAGGVPEEGRHVVVPGLPLELHHGRQDPLLVLHGGGEDHDHRRLRRGEVVLGEDPEQLHCVPLLSITPKSMKSPGFNLLMQGMLNLATIGPISATVYFDIFSFFGCV
jgi:hypothetical protein